MKMKCALLEQQLEVGSCLTRTLDGKERRACEVTLHISKDTTPPVYSRLIKSMHLSRPEDYFSIYQSGCNHDCKKCHSANFSKQVNGSWIDNNKVADFAQEYSKKVTVFEPKNQATMWHAEELCYHCGSCVLHGKRSQFCPQKVSPDQIVMSPQGFGTARNIIAFTGGDLTCHPDYYADAASKIKEATNDKLWVLIETNGYALTRKNLQSLKEGEVDSFWLDIKAFDNHIYKELCGTSNESVLASLGHMVDMDFTVEVLTLYIPSMVETNQHKQIAELIVDLDDSIPTTLLAFFPTYRLKHLKKPSFEEMMTSYHTMKQTGLRNIRLGNIGVFTNTFEERSEVYRIRKEP